MNPPDRSGQVREGAQQEAGIPREIMTEILGVYALPLDGVHGAAHWGRVLETGRRLAATTGADRAVLTLFAVFHDARRLSEGADPDHGRRGADLALRLGPRLGLTPAQLAQLAFACAHHADGLTEGDVTVRTCWDADRLDLWRVGLTPQRGLLCTEAARAAEIRRWCRVRSLEDHRPDCAREWLRMAASRARRESDGRRGS